MKWKKNGLQDKDASVNQQNLIKQREYWKCGWVLGFFFTMHNKYYSHHGRDVKWQAEGEKEKINAD